MDVGTESRYFVGEKAKGRSMDKGVVGGAFPAYVKSIPIREEGSSEIQEINAWDSNFNGKPESLRCAYEPVQTQSMSSTYLHHSETWVRRGCTVWKTSLFNLDMKSSDMRESGGDPMGIPMPGGSL